MNAHVPASIRQADDGDFGAIMAFRLALFEEMGHSLDGEAREALILQHVDWWRLHPGRVVTWLAEQQGQAVACGSLALIDRLPAPGHAKGLDGYLQNMYTLPNARGQGLGHAIVRTIQDWAAQEGLGMVMLHASEGGAPVYRRCGFSPVGSYLEWRPASAGV
jgi:GNAT superfamily N-acetyltransferase